MDNLNQETGSSEASILDRLTALRSESEPAVPTDEPQAQEVTPDEAEEEEQEIAQEPEAENVEQLEESDAPTEDDSELVYDLGGREVSAKQILEWEQGSLREADYRRKTMRVADERKEVSKTQELLTAAKGALESKIAELEVILNEVDTSTYDGMTLEELRDYDAGAYLKQVELNKKREDAIKSAKTKLESMSDEDKQLKIQSTQNALIEANKHWVKDGKMTKEYEADMNLVNDYLLKSGYTPEDQSNILSAKHWSAIIDAAKYKAGKQANAAIAKKVRKAPKLTKPEGARINSSQKTLQAAQERHSREGSVESAIALRKAQQNIKKVN